MNRRAGCRISTSMKSCSARTFYRRTRWSAWTAAFSRWRAALLTRRAFGSRFMRCFACISPAARLAAPPPCWKRSGWRPTRRSCPFRRIASTLPTARCFSAARSKPRRNSAATACRSTMTPPRRSR